MATLTDIPPCVLTLVLSVELFPRRLKFREIILKCSHVVVVALVHLDLEGTQGLYSLPVMHHGHTQV